MVSAYQSGCRGIQMPGISFVEVMGFERLDGLRRAKGKAVA